jgi:integrase/recombinase XerC
MARAAESTRRDLSVPTDDEVRALIAACSNRAPTGIRNKALIAVLWRCGLRIAEALALELKDVDLTANEIDVLGKGDKRRKLGVDDTTAALVARWIDKRASLGYNGKGTPLFCTLDGHTIKQQYVRALFPRLAAKADIERRMHAHGMRHAFAHRLAKEGASVVTIRDALGHSSLAVTDRYLREVAPVHVLRTMQQADWEL